MATSPILRSSPTALRRRQARTKQTSLTLFPTAARQLQHRRRSERNDAHAPTLGIEDVFQRPLAYDIIVNDQYSDFGQSHSARTAPWFLPKVYRPGEAKDAGRKAGFSPHTCHYGQAKQRRIKSLDIANKKRI